MDSSDDTITASGRRVSEQTAESLEAASIPFVGGRGEPTLVDVTEPDHLGAGLAPHPGVQGAEPPDPCHHDAQGVPWPAGLRH